MPSQRGTLETNVNNSKNTRMDLDYSAKDMDYRKDEIMFISRYCKGAQDIVGLSKKLGRPIRVLDIGCGQMNTARLFYKSYRTKKSDVLKSYTGIDIDAGMAEKCTQLYQSTYKACNANFVIQDLTVNPRIDARDNYYDLIICTEFLEHIDPTKSQAILKEAYRVLNPEGVAVFSTPNSNGSNSKLPKDHFYEYSYEELIDKFEAAGFEIENTVGLCINKSKIPKDTISSLDAVFSRFDAGFGRNSAFACVAVAPLIESKYCKNVLYILSKPTD